MPFLEIRGLAKSFGDHAVLLDLALAVEEGEVLALLGPSGSGKTTLLRILAGFEQPDRGLVLVSGDDVSGTPPARRGFGMVFQHYALFPHLSVGENLAFGLHGHGLPPERVTERVAEVLASVDLAGFEERAVSQISGGQQQRVALARAIAPRPRLLLLDEPLSNLDPDLRERTRRRLRDTLSKVGITTVLVTHEQEEAFDLGDRVAVLNGGRLQQVDQPEEIYRRPANRFVAAFVGRMSFLPATLQGDGRALVGRDPAGEDVLWSGDLSASEAPVGPRVEVAVRPESLELSAANEEGVLVGCARESRFTGMVHLVAVELAQGDRLEVAVEEAPTTGEPVGVRVRASGVRPRFFALAEDEGEHGP